MNAVAAVNAPLAYAAFVATYLPILAELRRDRHGQVAEEDAFLIRIPLIHDYRRPLLRKELYRRLAGALLRALPRPLPGAARRHYPPADPAFADRFPQDDPLAAMWL